MKMRQCSGTVRKVEDEQHFDETQDHIGKQVDGQQHGQHITTLPEGHSACIIPFVNTHYFQLLSIKRFPACFVPDQYDNKSRDRATQVGEVRQVITRDIGHTTKEVDRCQSQHGPFGLDGDRDEHDV